MKLMGLIAVAMLALSSAASAATYRLDVTGMLEDYRFGTGSPTVIGVPSLIGLVRPVSDVSENLAFDRFFRGRTTGSATFTQQNFDTDRVVYSECSGLLELMCNPGIGYANFKTFEVDFISSSLAISPTDFIFSTDATFSFDYLGITYLGFGYDIRGAISSINVTPLGPTPVPLPASGWLLFGAMGALALRRKRARG